VKRLALPTYRYTGHDLRHLHIVLAEDSAAGVIGIAAWEAAAARDCPQGLSGLLLHGLYVDPEQQRRGTGTRLLAAAAAAAREQGFDGLLVKAQADAEGFFRAQGLERLAVADAGRDYPHRFRLDHGTPNRLKDAVKVMDQHSAKLIKGLHFASMLHAGVSERESGFNECCCG